MATAELIARLDLDVARFTNGSKQAEQSINRIGQAVQRTRQTSPILDALGRQIQSSGLFARHGADDFVRWGRAWGTASTLVSNGLTPVRARADAAADGLKRVAREGLHDLASDVPIVGSSLHGLIRTLGGFPLILGGITGAGLALINWLRETQEQSTRTLASVTNLAEGIQSQFREVQSAVEAIRATARGDILGGLAGTLAAQLERIRRQREEATRSLTAERDVALSQVGGPGTIESLVGAILPPSFRDRLFASKREGIEGELKAKQADVDIKAENERRLAIAQNQAQTLQFEKAQQAAVLETARVRTDAVLQVRQIEAQAAHDRIGEIEAGLGRALAAAEAERQAKIQALGPGVRPDDARVAAANAESEAKVTLAKAQAAAQRRKLEEDLATAEIALRQEVTQAALAANAEVLAAANARAEAERRLAGDTVGAEQAAAQGRIAAQQADLDAFRQAQAAKLEDYNRSLDLQFGKAAEIEQRIQQAQDEGRDEEAAKLQAQLDQVNQLREQKTQAVGAAVTAKEQATANQIAAIHLEAQARIEQAVAERAAKQADLANRVASAEQGLVDAQARARDAAIDGEAELRAARLKASGDAEGAERVLAQARIDGIERALAEEVQRHETTIANLRREIEAQQVAAQSSDVQARAEAETKIYELTAKIGEEEAAISEARARSSVEIEKQRIGMTEVVSLGQQFAQQQEAAAHAVTQAIQAQQAALANLAAVAGDVQRGFGDLQFQLAALSTQGEFGFVQDPELRRQIEELRNRIVQSTGSLRDLAIKQYQAFLDAHKDQLDQDRLVASIMQERQQLDEQRNRLLQQIRDLQQKFADAALAAFQAAAEATGAGLGVPFRTPQLNFDSGGLVPGLGSAGVPAIVHPGELVIPRDTVQALMRRRGDGHGSYAVGGIVSSQPVQPPSGGSRGQSAPIIVQLVVDKSVLARVVVPAVRDESKRGRV